MKTLKLAEGIELPIDIATQTLLVVGKRGSGKSNTCVRLAEQLFEAKVPFVAIDPVDNWWGLKSSKDGTKPGLPITIFGGKHADVPLESTGGSLVADVIVENRSSAVLSIRHFSGRERSRFVADFFDRLYRKNSEALHVFLEEAHEVAPQVIPKGEGAEEMVGRVTRIWKLGRTSGLGGSAITQRPASLSKNITTQAEILIVHRMIGPQDVAAIKEWIKYHGESEEILGELSGLKTGEAFLWAPDFPEGNPLGLRRVKILERETFDSASTPKAGHVRREPKVLAQPDLERLRSKMAESIERAKAEDPRELRKEIAGLKAELRKAQAEKPAPVKVERVEVPVLREHDFMALRACGATLTRLQDDAAQALGIWKERMSDLEKRLATIKTQSSPSAAAPRASGPPAPRNTKGAAPSSSRPSNEGGKQEAGLNGPEQRILDAIAWLEAIGVAAPQQTAVAFLAGYTVGGGAFNNPRGSLRTKGLVDYVGSDGIRLTETGRAAANPPPQALTPSELQDRVLDRLPGPEQKILRVLLDEYPQSVENGELARRAGYAPDGGAFNNPRGRLRSLGLIDYPERGRVVAKQLLFLEGA